ncbi:Hypothetical protein (Fragment) [Durusdinium trenchii]|uniref:Uncharacterized protein n=1 Tax=Durusdinium trenchii TaxID=1381693 RepID=A0ABP0S8G6_9DINO
MAVPMRFMLLAGALMLRVLPAQSESEDSTCSAQDVDAGRCTMEEQLVDSLASELDGVAKDIQKICPLYDSQLTPVAMWLLGILKRITGTMSMLSLWPSGVHPETFADECATSAVPAARRHELAYRCIVYWVSLDQLLPQTDGSVCLADVHGLGHDDHWPNPHGPLQDTRPRPGNQDMPRVFTAEML